MDRRFWQQITVLLAIVFSITIQYGHCSPAFRIKHYNRVKPHQMPNLRTERRIIGGSSPIHFISPYVAAAPQPVHSFDELFFPPVPMGKTSPSSIYKLPLQFYNNGKPHKVMHVVPRKRIQYHDFFSQGDSNIIRLPLKFVSNGKPIDYSSVYMLRNKIKDVKGLPMFFSKDNIRPFEIISDVSRIKGNYGDATLQERILCLITWTSGVS